MILSALKLDLNKVDISKEEPLLLREVHDENHNPNGGPPAESMIATDRDHNPMSSPSSLSYPPTSKEEPTESEIAMPAASSPILKDFEFTVEEKAPSPPP